MIGASKRACGATLVRALAVSPAIAEEPTIDAPMATTIPLWSPAQERTQGLEKWMSVPPRRQTEPVSEKVWSPPFRSGVTTAMTKPKIAVFTGERGAATISFAVIRSKAVRIDGLSSFAHPRFSSMEAVARFEVQLGNSGVVNLSGNWALERRRPSFEAGSHSQYKNVGRALTLTWTHDEKLRLSLGAFDIGPSGHRSNLERFANLAAGGPRASKGVGISIECLAGADSDQFSFGLELKQTRSEVSHSEGQVIFRPEGRISTFLMAKF